MTKIESRFSSRALGTLALASMLAIACGEADVPEPSVPSSVSTSSSASATGASGPVASSTPAPAVLAGSSSANGTEPGGSSGSLPSGGGSLDTPWCKTKAVLDKHCVVCHQNPTVAGAPFPLTSYSELTAPHPSKPGKKIYERVALRVHPDKSRSEGLVMMPPGKELSAADIALIDAWALAGAPAGENPGCTPATGSPTPDAGVPTAQEWPLKECDAVYKITSHGAGGIDTPNSAPPGRESHPQVAWDAPWGDEQVQAIAFKSITDNAAVLHHWILSGRPGGMLVGWAPGEEAIQEMPKDVGMAMPTGKGSLNLDMHYFNTTGTSAQLDKSGVEVCVVKKERFRKNNAGVATRLVAARLSIPPNATNYEAKGSCTVSGSTPITLLNASPHAHKLAVRMIFKVTKKNGQVIQLHDMPFMFGEQGTYALDPPVVVESGDVIDTTCVFTNKSNQTITFGESTNDEMCFNFALYYPAGALTCGAAAAGSTSSGFFGL